MIRVPAQPWPWCPSSSADHAIALAQARHTILM